MRNVWSKEIKDSLYQGLEAELDNKTFYNAPSLYKAPSLTTPNSTLSSTVASPNTGVGTDSFASLGHISFTTESTDANFSSTSIKGMSFANRVERDKKVTSVKDLTPGNQKIYKIEDLLSANFAETTVIPLSTIPTNLSLVKRYEWKDILFADVGEAFSMIKNRFFR